MSRGNTPSFRASTPANDPRYDGRWKMPGYTGHVNGVYETIGTTPVASQRKALFRNGSELDPLHKPKVAEEWRDPCNDPSTYKKANPELLWPSIAEPHGLKKNLNNQSSIVFGDRRFFQNNTHYNDTHIAPRLQQSLWTPELKNKNIKQDLVNMSLEDRTALYKKMTDKLGEVQLKHIVENLRLRFAAKLNTASNSNGFRLLKLFQNYDANGTGSLEMEEFVRALHAFGVQLPEDAEIVLFANFDANKDGRLDYTEFISSLVEPEYLVLGFSSVIKDDKKLDAKVHEIEFILKNRFQQLLTGDTGGMMKDLFRKFDTDGNGTISREEFLEALLKLNIQVNGIELDAIFKNASDTNGRLDYEHFAAHFVPSIGESSLGASRLNTQCSQRNFTYG